VSSHEVSQTNLCSPTTVLTLFICAESQTHTQQAGRRPYGVGLLIAAYDVRIERRKASIKVWANFDSSILYFDDVVCVSDHAILMYDVSI
jgi:20S proteasome alpha/beta subunit